MKNFALVGSPNSGKTTLYNWITGAKYSTVNYPGSTVDFAIGNLAKHFQARWSSLSKCRFIDTPGVYSLAPQSADEEVTRDILKNGIDETQVDAVILVIDAIQIERQLQLAHQLMQANVPFFVVITMRDLMAKAQIQYDFSLLAHSLQTQILTFDGLLGGGLDDVFQAVQKFSDRSLAPGANRQFVFDHTQSVVFAGQLFRRIAPDQELRRKLARLREQSNRIDQIMLHHWLGPLIFFGVMALLFSSIYTFAAPFMDLIDLGFSTVNQTIADTFGETLWVDFLTNGLIASVGAVVIFVPQIFLLFLIIGVLEGTGYLARAAALVDQWLFRLGLSGRSFVPLLSGFSCAVPAMMAARNISSKREKWITLFVIPLLTCSARLPVYTLLIGFLIGSQAGWGPVWGGILLATLYFFGLLVGGLAAAVLHRIIPAQPGGFLMLELPLYRRPLWGQVFSLATRKTKSYATRAGPIIFVLAVIIWGLSSFPRVVAEPDGAAMPPAIEQSYLGKAGAQFAPLFEPMGADWRVGIAMMSAFAAREVFVATLALTLRVDADAEESEEGLQKALLQNMNNATWPDGRPLFTTASVVALLMFFVIALQCLSTVGVAVREFGSWTYALVQLVSFNAIAYGLAVAVYHLLIALQV